MPRPKKNCAKCWAKRPNQSDPHVRVPSSILVIECGEREVVRAEGRGGEACAAVEVAGGIVRPSIAHGDGRGDLVGPDDDFVAVDQTPSSTAQAVPLVKTNAANSTPDAEQMVGIAGLAGISLRRPPANHRLPTTPRAGMGALHYTSLCVLPDLGQSLKRSLVWMAFPAKPRK